MRKADVAAAVAIVLAGALSAAWAFIVPIFQAPDEPAHFDYAISIYGAHRLIRVAEGEPAWIVSPYTKYLLRAVEFNRIERHSSMRVPQGYGSVRYFRRIDASAPPLFETVLPQGRVNYIVPAYPFGFYALEALWMGAAAHATGSAVAMFYAGRLLCVLLLMVGLYYNYRTALLLGMPPWVSVGIVTAVGLFPMTSFVSSYIQPDNLAYALVSAALFYALCLRSSSPRRARLLPLGICLGALAVTKYQFFAAVAVPVGFLVAVRGAKLRFSRRRWFESAAFVAVPAAVLLLVQYWFVDRPQAHGPPPAAGLSLDYFRSMVALGPAATFYYVIAATWGAFVDFFVSGSCAVTYWQVVGWFDTPIVIFSSHFETIIRIVIGLTTAAVVLVLAFGLLRNGVRLVQAARGGQTRSALAIAASDPVYGSYVLFVVFMFALYVATANGFTAEGRHWYPFIFPAFLCLAWYAPRVLWKRSLSATVVLTCVLLCYSAVAAGYGIADVIARYYGPSAARYVALHPRADQIRPGFAAGLLHQLEDDAYHVNGPATRFAFGKGSRLFVSGAVLSSPGTVPRVAIMLDGIVPIPVLDGQFEQYVAEAAHSVDRGYGGFRAYVETAGLPEGAHTVTAFALLADGDHFMQLQPERTFFVTDRDGGFSSLRIRSLSMSRTVSGELHVDGACRGAISRIGGSPSIRPGGVVLVNGNLAAGGRPGRYDGAWLLVGNRPYPALYSPATGRLTGTVDTEKLQAGLHRVYAYLSLAGNAGVRRVSGTTAFRVLGAAGRPPPDLAQPVCSDRLRLLAGT